MVQSRERISLSIVVFVALFAQAILYSGIPELVEALGASPELGAGVLFLGTEFTAFIIFAAVWGALSDSTGRRVPFIVGGALVASVAYLFIGIAPSMSIPFAGVLVLRVVQGAASVGAFSLALTMLMDLEGGHGRNMGAAGVSIGAGVALGVPFGGFIYEVGALVPLYVASALMLVAAVFAFLV
ncbi:MAG: MFS transporter, partial [Halobacteria archaeon]|nr:MFS transporter [Halobacteria archaeon]